MRAARDDSGLVGPGAPPGWTPKVGDVVRGRFGRQEYVGVVLESKRLPGCPAITRVAETVGVYVRTADGRQYVVCQVVPAAKLEE